MCCGLHSFVPPNSYVETQTHDGMVFGDGSNGAEVEVGNKVMKMEPS